MPSPRRRSPTLGWEPVDGEDDLTGKLRGLLVGTLAVLGADADAAALPGDLRRSRRASHPELVAAATNVVAAVGDEADYERFLEAFRTRADTAGAAALPLRARRVPDGRAGRSARASWR